jgi:ABC-2 type transport system ATP-binding protein
MKRRLMIAKALVHNPKLLLLDEPTAGVDITLRETLWDFVRELKKEGMSILLTTHYLEEAEVLCDRVGIINRGRIETMGPTKGIIKDFTQREMVLTLNHEITVPPPLLLARDGNSYRVLIPSGMNIGQILSDLQVESNRIVDLQIN